MRLSLQEITFIHFILRALARRGFLTRDAYYYVPDRNNHDAVIDREAVSFTDTLIHHFEPHLIGIYSLDDVRRILNANFLAAYEPMTTAQSHLDSLQVADSVFHETPDVQFLSYVIGTLRGIRQKIL